MFIGNQKVIHHLQRSVKNDALTNGYVFSGPSRVGKFTAAMMTVKAVFCDQNEVQSCDKCQSCLQFQAGAHPDVYILREEEGKKSISIKQVRQIRDALQSSSMRGGWHFAVIDNADLLTVEACNALLKILEEPPAKTAIFFITPNANVLPQTIVSRSTHLRFHTVQKSEIRALLRERCKETADEVRDDIASLASGRPGVAIKMAEDQAYYEEFLKLFTRSLQYMAGHVIMDIKEVEKLLSLPDYAEWLGYLVRDIVNIRLGNEEITFTPYRNVLRQFAKRYDKKKMEQALEIVLDVNERMGQSAVNEKLLVQNALMRLSV